MDWHEKTSKPECNIGNIDTVGGDSTGVSYESIIGVEISFCSEHYQTGGQLLPAHQIVLIMSIC